MSMSCLCIDNCPKFHRNAISLSTVSPLSIKNVIKGFFIVTRTENIDCYLPVHNESHFWIILVQNPGIGLCAVNESGDLHYKKQGAFYKA